jgi:uncharacterized protein (TIRG00374 family)
MLTPFQTGGGFGQIYMLKRGGANLSTALTDSLIPFTGTVIGFFCVGVYLIFLTRIEYCGILLRGSIWAFTAICSLMILGAFCPGLFRFSISLSSSMLSWIVERSAAEGVRLVPNNKRSDDPRYPMGRLDSWLIALVYNYHQGVRLFFTKGKVHFVLVLLFTLIFMLSRCVTAFLCLRILGIDNSSLAHVLQVQLAIMILVYFAPTPGASGLAESASLSMMGNIIPVGFLPYYNIVWWCTTLFITGMAALICLVPAIIRDGRGLVKHKASFVSEKEENRFSGD